MINLGLFEEGKTNIIDLHAELGHSSEVIIHATTKSMDIEVTDSFKQCEDCTLRKVNIGRVCKKAVGHLKISGKRLFFNISSLLNPTFGGNKHFLLILKDSVEYTWTFF